MPRARQPTDVIKAKGAKHLSQTEERTRRAGEVKVPAPEKAKPPRWLGHGFHPDVSKVLKAEFRRLGQKLIDAGLYTELDADTLATYLVSRHQWEIATAEAETALETADPKTAGDWSKIQERYFAGARKCANELGLTVSSRCKLVIPPTAQTEDNAPEDEFTRILRNRQMAAGGL